MKQSSTIKCPNKECGQIHALFWLVSGPRKKQLSYRCHRILKIYPDPVNPEKTISRFRNGDLPAPDGVEPVGELPERLSAGYRKKLQAEKQYQLVMVK